LGLRLRRPVLKTMEIDIAELKKLIAEEDFPPEAKEGVEKILAGKGEGKLAGEDAEAVKVLLLAEADILDAEAKFLDKSLAAFDDFSSQVEDVPDNSSSKEWDKLEDEIVQKLRNLRSPKKS
jgi:hypothetical protein